MVFNFLQMQMDYILFFYGFAFIILAATTWGLSSSEGRQLPWKWLCLFGLVHGINEWLDLLALSVKDSLSYSVVRLAVMAASFLFLIEFGRSGSNAVREKEIGRWVFIPLLSLAGLGAIAGIPGLNSAVRYALALPGAFWSSLTLWQFRRDAYPESRPLLVAAFSILFYGLATGIVVPEASFFPASFLNHDSFFALTGFPIQLLRGVLACAIAAAIWQHYCSCRKETFKSFISTTVFHKEILTIVAVVTVLAAGWIMTISFGEYGQKRDEERYRSQLELARRMLEDSAQNSSDLTKALAASPSLISMGDKNHRDLAAINSTLDRYARVIRGSVCYVLDLDGTALASSNRDTAESFVRQSYGVRSYFKKAREGLEGSYVAVGLTSKMPGYYTGHPIRDPNGKIVGVAVIKLNLDTLFVSPMVSNVGFLVNSSGIIISSTKPGFFLKTLRPISEVILRGFTETKQFPFIVDLPILPADSVPGTMFAFQGEVVQEFMRTTSVEDLSFVVLGPMSSWKTMRLMSIFITLLVTVLLLAFFVIQQRSNESSVRIAASESLYRTLVDGSPNWIGLFDHQGRCIAINKNGLATMDLTETEVHGRSFTEIFSRDSDHLLGDSVRRVLGGERLFFETNQSRSDGSSITWYVVLNPVSKQDGRAYSFVGIATDISARKKAEQSLRESEERFRIMFARHNAVMLLLEPKSGRIVDANRSAEQFYGYTKEELGSMQIQNINILPPGKIAEERHQAMGEKRNYFIFPHRLANGLIRTVEVHSTPIKVHDKELLFSIIHDITARKLAEEALKESEQRHREYIANTPFGVFVANEQGEYLQVNPAACRITGYTEEELLAMSIPDLLFKETLAEDILHFQTLVREGKSQCEIRFCPKNGERRWWSVTAVKISDKRFLGFCNDITDRKFAEEERVNLEAENRQLQKAESLSRMAGAIAHHFNNQLGAVIGNLEMAIDDVPGSSDTAKILNAAMEASYKAVEVSSLMLTYLGQTSGNHVPLDLSEACRQVLPLLQAATPNGIVFNVDLPSPGPTISANLNQIQQVVTNLATNAWEAAEKNPGNIRITVKIASSEDISATRHFPIDWQSQGLPYACLEVADDGLGIAAEDIAKLFDPFFTTKFTGRGLGLPIVEGIAKMHNGVVTVQSERERGSIFRVFFPLYEKEVSQLFG